MPEELKHHDLLGRWVKPGDILAFATRRFSTCEMKFAKLLELTLTKTGWRPGTMRLKIRSVRKNYRGEWELSTRAGYLEPNSEFIILDYVPTDLQKVFDTI